MLLTNPRPAGRIVVWSVWAGGLATGIGATAWSLTHSPVRPTAFEPFLSMAAVLFINDTLPTFGERAWLSRWPIVGLTATVIAFSNDPLVGVLAIVVAAPLAGFLNGQSLGEELTKTVWWLVAYGVGILAFGLLTAGHTGFALAALVLVLLYAVCETLMASFDFLARGSGSGIVHRLDGFSTPLFFGMQGVIYGLSWRSPYLGLLGRDLGQVAIVASIVIVIGCLLGGSIANLWRKLYQVRARTAFLVVVVGVGAIVLPRGMGWAVVSLGVAAVLVVSVTARSLGGTVTCIGALANLAVAQLNGGMPTEANAFFRLVGPAGYARYASRTYLENLNTKLPLLDDRIVLPHPIPFAEVFSVGDLIIMIGLVVIILEGMLARPVASSSVLDEGQIVA